MLDQSDAVIEVIDTIERRETSDGARAIAPEDGELRRVGVRHRVCQLAEAREFIGRKPVLGENQKINVAVAGAEAAMGETPDEMHAEEAWAEIVGDGHSDAACKVRRLIAYRVEVS